MRLGGGGAGPLTWDEIQKKCKETWTIERLKESLFKSVRGLPSVAQIIKIVSKDKDILAALAAVESGDVDIYVKTTPHRDPQIAGTAHTDLKKDTTTARVITIYMDPGQVANIHNSVNRIFGFIDQSVQDWNQHYLRSIEDPRNSYLNRFGGEALDYWSQGAIPRDQLDNFVNLWGFTFLLNSALILVHELAHVFDPDNISNLIASEEEGDRYYLAHTKWDPDQNKGPHNARIVRFVKSVKKYLRTDSAKREEEAKKAWKKFKEAESGRAEMFATNRAHDFTADLEDSELLKLVYSPGAGGPTNLSASGVNLEKFSLTNSLAPPPTKDDVSPDAPRPDILLKRLNSQYYNIFYGLGHEGGEDGAENQYTIWGSLIDSFAGWGERYSKSCRKKLHMMSKDIELDFYGLAGGESDDRLAPDNYRDRKYITRTTRSANRKIGLDESKKRIKINII